MTIVETWIWTWAAVKLRTSRCDQILEMGAARQDEEAMVRMKIVNELHILTIEYKVRTLLSISYGIVFAR
jgi:hypothetical protein